MPDEFRYTRLHAYGSCSNCDSLERMAREDWEKEQAEKRAAEKPVREPFKLSFEKCANTYGECKTCARQEAAERAAYDAETERLNAEEKKGKGTNAMYAVKITGYGNNKIATIKLVREFNTGMDLKSAKEAVEAASDDAPLTVGEYMYKDDAHWLAEKFYDAAGTVEPFVFVTEPEKRDTSFLDREDAFVCGRKVTVRERVALEKAAKFGESYEQTALRLALARALGGVDSAQA